MALRIRTYFLIFSLTFTPECALKKIALYLGAVPFPPPYLYDSSIIRFCLFSLQKAASVSAAVSIFIERNLVQVTSISGFKARTVCLTCLHLSSCCAMTCSSLRSQKGHQNISQEELLLPNIQQFPINTYGVTKAGHAG